MKLTNNQKHELKSKMYSFNWIKILQNAIESRPTSWYPTGFVPMDTKGKFRSKETYSPAEWRNASDEICNAVLRAMEKENMLIPLFKEAGDV